jgi:hypothetical protein
MKQHTYLERYLAGEYTQVWEELRRLDTGEVYKEPLFSDMYGVAHETMRRVKTNIETLIQRWQTLEMEFENPGMVLVPPEPELSHGFSRFEQEIGRLPLSIRAFWEIVGSVNFCGEDFTFTRPGTELYYQSSDPLWIDPASMVMNDAMENFRLTTTGDSEKRPELAFRGCFAPDIYHKDDVSGGANPEFQLTPGVDCGVYETWYTGDDEGMPFVDYLRLSIAWAGYPGFSRYNQPPLSRKMHKPRFEEGDDLPALLKNMAKDLLPF